MKQMWHHGVVWGAISGLLLCSSIPALAQTAYLLPQASSNNAAPANTQRIVAGILDLSEGRGMGMEMPQTFAAMRYEWISPAPSPEQTTETPPAPAGNEPPAPPIERLERSEHLSTLEETTLFGSTAWATEVALPHSGVYQFVLETKPTWTPEQDTFISHVAKVMLASEEIDSSWSKQTGVLLEIIPLSRPLGLCAGMSFSGRVVRAGEPVPNALVAVVSLPSDALARGTRKNKKGEPVPLPMRGVEQEVVTDERGVFTFTCPWWGWWGFAVTLPGLDPLLDPDGVLKPVVLKSVLWVNVEDCK